MSFQVKILARAQIEFESQVAYLHKRSPKGAKSWAVEFSSTIDLIAADPYRYVIAPESESYDQEIREARFQTANGNPYRIVFTISKEGNLVFVFSVRGLGQDYVEL